MADTSPASFRYTLRFLCASLMSSQVVLMLAVSAAIGSDGFTSPPAWALAVVVLVGIVEATVIPMIGYRVPAIAPGAPADETRKAVAGAVQSSTIVRFALAEAVAIISIALAFIVGEGGALVCSIGVLFCLVLSALHVWPSRRVLTRMRESLERDGGLSRLDEVMDAPPASRRS